MLVVEWVVVMAAILVVRTVASLVARWVDMTVLSRVVMTEVVMVVP